MQQTKCDFQVRRGAQQTKPGYWTKGEEKQTIAANKQEEGCSKLSTVIQQEGPNKSSEAASLEEGHNKPRWAAKQEGCKLSY